MKKIISILLSIVLLFSCGIIAVTAEDSKIDSKLIEKLDETQGVFTTLPVYIELNPDAKIPKEMPSWENSALDALREYFDYIQQEQSPVYDSIVEELSNITHLENIRNVCYDALTCRVQNSKEEINKLAENKNVKSIRYFKSGEAWETDYQRYDYLNTRNRYRERLVSQYDYFGSFVPCMMYQEIYYHHYAPDDKEYGFDWALVDASYGTCVATAIYSQVVGGRLLYAPNTFQKPFAFDIGIYDAEQDRFFDVAEIDFDDYPDLYEVWQKLDLGDRTAYEIYGDADGDMDVTILDATKIQRCVAGLDSKNSIVATGADADGDGEMTVLDATRIQRYKAGLCELSGTIIDDTDKETENLENYELGSLLVSVQAGTPRSLSRARNTVIDTLRDFNMESIGMLASTESYAVFKVDLAEKSAENDRLAIVTLEENADVISAKPYQDEFSRYEPDHFGLGRVIVSGDYGNLLKGFEIESTRLLTPGSGRAVYLIIFKEKSKEIVWRALEVLEGNSSIIAEPDFIGSFDV